MEKLIDHLPTWLRAILGAWMMKLALQMLPKGETMKEGALRGMKEQREFDRYEGYTQILGEKPIPFLRWREIMGTFRLRSEVGIRYTL